MVRRILHLQLGTLCGIHPQTHPTGRQDLPLWGMFLASFMWFVLVSWRFTDCSNIFLSDFLHGSVRLPARSANPIPNRPHVLDLDVWHISNTLHVHVRILRSSQGNYVLRFQRFPRHFLVRICPPNHFILCTDYFDYSYANGPQTIALFGLGLQRFPALIGTLTFMSLCVHPVIVTLFLRRH